MLRPSGLVVALLALPILIGVPALRTMLGSAVAGALLWSTLVRGPGPGPARARWYHVAVPSALAAILLAVALFAHATLAPR